LPLARNAFVRFHYVAVRQSEMLAWVMHDATSSSAPAMRGHLIMQAHRG
jgi:hypothetical protein